MDHLTDNEIMDYAQGACDAHRAMAVDAHVDECVSCMRRARGALYLVNNLNDVWQAWTAESHGLLHRQLQLARALSEGNPGGEVASKAMAWLQRMTQGMELTARALIDRSKGVGLAAVGTVTGAFTAQLAPAYQGVGFVEAAKVQEYLDQGSELLSSQDADGAVQSVSQALHIDARAAQSTTLEIRSEDEVIARVVVDARRHRVSVLSWSPDIAAPGRMALLIPADEAVTPRLGVFGEIPNAAYCLVEFGDLPDGEYVIRVET